MWEDIPARARIAASDNVFEGVYLDDFVIGFAERGELATASDVVVDPFVADRRREFPQPDDPISDLTTGSYQVEIRDASEYVSSASGTRFRTYDTNQRLTDSRSIVANSAADLQDGLTFSINDGRSTVTFEFDLVDSGTGVRPGNVQIPFTLQLTDPITEEVRPQTAEEVAASIIDAINRADVQSVIDVPALAGNGVDTRGDATINLFGDVIVSDPSGALAAINRETLRGDDNRDRDGQGVIVIENSRFLFNEQYGLNINHGLTANVDGVDTESLIRYPRNLVELNTESLVPGVVVQSNVFAFNTLGGLQIEGIDSATSETISDPLPFERIVNNTIIGGVITPGTESPSETFQGILFEQGLISFADVVAEYVPDAGGGEPSAANQLADTALGAPDSTGRGPEPINGLTTVSLGLGGTITLQFTDNLLTGSGDARPDLIVFETGEVESVRVEISRDGTTFFDVGIVGGLTNTVDLDEFGFGTESRFSFVRLTDLRQGDTTGTTLGADIDAVGCDQHRPDRNNSTAGGTGVNITGSAAPTRAQQRDQQTRSSVNRAWTRPTASFVLIGGNTYYRNTQEHHLTDVLAGRPSHKSDRPTPKPLFVDRVRALVFAPAAGSQSIIDSSIDSLEDRAEPDDRPKNAVGHSAERRFSRRRLDVNGQFRESTTPTSKPPGGLGERVFKDRGASDRGDLTTAPRVTAAVTRSLPTCRTGCRSGRPIRRCRTPGRIRNSAG